MSPGRRPGTADWGVDDGYESTTGEWRTTSEATRQAVRRAMKESSGPSPADRPIVLSAGQRRAVDAPGELTLEDGTVVPVHDHLPASVPPGYHRLESAGRQVRVIVAPPRCPGPAARMWGWAVQLYGARSAASWGVGDLADLRWLGSWARRSGAGFLLVNPLVAPTPLTPVEPSPYFPSSRLFRNLLYLRIEEVPGADTLPGLESLAARGRSLNAHQRLDRDHAWGLKLEALERLWTGTGASPEFDRFRTAQGPPLQSFATYCVLAELHGRDWRAWPEEYRHPGSAAVRAVATRCPRRVAFHAWLQWLLDRQVARAAAALPIVQDLPIGVDPGGADAWAWQDAMASGVVVGAPPDRYNPLGQSWGLAPFIPGRLVAAGYDPFIQMLRASLRHAGGLRIDHVMGLFRLYWIPDAHAPADGAFVRYPAEDLLAIVALESERAGAFVVGEDLGTIEAGVRERLAARNVLSYRVLWFEEGALAQLPERALASVTTHDLPTIMGLWSGEDVRTLRSLGLQPNEAAFEAIRERVRRVVAAGEASPERVITAVHRHLATAPCALLTATLEDALAVPHRPNVPGAPVGWPNWSRGLPEPIEHLETAPLPRSIARALSAAVASDRAIG